MTEPSEARTPKGAGDPGHTRFVLLREGLVPITVPPEVVLRLQGVAGTAAGLDAPLDVAALIIARLGNEAGSVMLTHVLEHDPELILDADARFAAALAFEPELIVGPLAGVSPVESA